MSYSSAATDGGSGQRITQQASWVGKGWSLDTGSVSANKMPNGQTYYSLVFDGQSYDLLRGAVLPGVINPHERNPSHWDWRPTDESFIRVRAVGNGVSSSTRGGYDLNGVAFPRYTWQVWAKDGTRYDFSEDAWWGWKCTSGDPAYLETYKWLLSAVTDPHGNTITYNYDRFSHTRSTTCFGVHGTVDHDVWPTMITWAGGRYRVTFGSEARAADTLYEGASNQYLTDTDAPHETRVLTNVVVLSNSSNPYQATAWERMREYDLDIDAGLLSDASISPSSPDAGVAGCPPSPTPVKCPDTVHTKLRLKSITRLGKDGVTALPPTQFTYNTTRGTAFYPNPGWNRLTQVDNGQGGILTLAYENIGAVRGDTLFYNNQRVITRTLNDGLTPPSSWTYSYGTPNINSLGTAKGGKGTTSYPNSAALYYNKYHDPYHNETNWLAHKAHREFRGHDSVLETDPNGAQIKHWFYQGEASDTCTPSVTGGGLINDPSGCFQRLRDGEFLKGKEYKTEIFAAGVDVDAASPLQRTIHTFVVLFYDYTVAPLTGLWHAFTYESQTDQKQYDGSGTPQIKTTTTFYNTSCTADTTTSVTASYGNVGCIREYDGTTLVRTTKRFYLLRDNASLTPPYMVDRVWQEAIYNGGGGLLALTNTFYDTTATADNAALLSAGDVRRVSKYYDLPTSPPVADTTGLTLHSSDTVSTYDTYGNQLTQTTYAGPGTRDYNNGVITWSSPGCSPSCSAARTTTTAYETRFNVFPIQVTNHLGHIQRADYDYRMGTLIRVTGPNTTGATEDCSVTTYAISDGEETSCAQYDAFGRLIKLIKPGDSTTNPTVAATYNDTALPFRYEIRRRESSGGASVRVEQQFYDGMGRKIQTKAESLDGTQNIVVDMRYNGLNQVIAESQPRYENQSGGDFSAYTPPTTLHNATVTSYDALGRTQVITRPDGLKTMIFYGITVVNGVPLSFVDTVDPNRHRVQQRSDALGRLVEVDEINGNCGNYWSSYGYGCQTPPTGTYTTTWTVDAVTRYTYSPLDLLTQANDALGNVTTMAYDSLGRKTSMIDPDMGAWAYAYDVNGNLTRQTDARNQRLCFFYDQLNRQTGKHANGTSDTCPGGTVSGDSVYAYDEVASSYGTGRRTAIINPAATTRWHYDARGRKVQEVYSNVAALPSGQTRTFAWTYDTADRVRTMTYPSGEVITQTYDVAWRPLSVCNGPSSCYAQASGSAPYTALDQPTQVTFGSGAVQSWSYASPLQRVEQIAVTNGGATTFFDRTYDYDNIGNVLAIADAVLGQTEHFGYDARDRLTRFWTTTGSGMAAPGFARAPDTGGSAPKLFAPTTDDRRPTTDDRRPTTDDRHCAAGVGGRRAGAARRPRPVRWATRFRTHGCNCQR